MSDAARRPTAQSQHSIASMHTDHGRRNAAPAPRPAHTLCTAYGVFGLPREASEWQSVASRVTHQRDAVKTFYKPVMLGSSPKDKSDHPEFQKLLHAAMRACLPKDIEIFMGEVQPTCNNHSFVLQQSSTSTSYGVCLQVWSKADSKRARTIAELRTKEERREVSPTETFWIPYVLCFLSPYPLFSLLGSYLRAMWVHWSKSSNLFHAEEVSRILGFPAPRLQDLVRIDMRDYALTYQFPVSSDAFQNFDLWPLFQCLSVPNIVGILETALSPQGRIIFTSDHLAILNIAAETVRFCCRAQGWSGLYVPVAHWSNVATLVAEEGPYIIGVPAECKTLLMPPSDALLVDLDRGFVQTSAPPVLFTKSSSRQKFIARLSAAIGFIEQHGVPSHLTESYAHNQLTPEGGVVAITGKIEVVQDPTWWKQEQVLFEIDRVATKLAKNRGLAAVLKGSQKKPATTKVLSKTLQELSREKNTNAREVAEAWQSYCALKTRMTVEVTKLTKRNDFLVGELGTWKAQFEKFQGIAEELTKQSLELKTKIDHYKLENRKLTLVIQERALEARKQAEVLARTEQERDAVIADNKRMSEELLKEKQHLKEKMRQMKTENDLLMKQRNEIEQVLLGLRELISEQPKQLEQILERKEPGQAQDTPEQASVNETAPAATTTKEVQSKRWSTISVSDSADALVREKTSEISALLNKMTSQCLSAIDAINERDDKSLRSLADCQTRDSTTHTSLPELARSISTMSSNRDSMLRSSESGHSAAAGKLRDIVEVVSDHASDATSVMSSEVDARFSSVVSLHGNETQTDQFKVHKTTQMDVLSTKSGSERGLVRQKVSLTSVRPGEPGKSFISADTIV
ncbi:AEX-3 domain-domain-containing protein [Protomyces lactucae-debilis]|uniref:AEX-3 domain-domain-containing protein n=1 Tax=Protomyces lactucae-debilis TaxID=2754530 RepID=A0A1Y2FEP6_PROLT|nr:AEX-3 domain-containing protein [Protomyces lactucae-debilis]ORY82077.1 AEX-3 domain-domain-containing protein [Protomyces lactucae-debilis]